MGNWMGFLWWYLAHSTERLPCSSLTCLNCPLHGTYKQYFYIRCWVHIYHKILKITPRAYIFKGPFWGAYFWRGLSTEGNWHFKIDLASLIVGSKFTVLALFYFVFEGNFPSTSPQRAYLEGLFNGGFFCVTGLGAYIRRGLHMEGLIFGILQFISYWYW